MPKELSLLFLSARISLRAEDTAAIRGLLSEGIDWTLFARKALDHGLAGLAGQSLARVAADLVPGDILAALGVVVEQTRKTNQILFDELIRLSKGLDDRGIDSIAFKGPVLALKTFGDLGLRVFRDLDILIGDADRDAAIAALCDLGYERKGQLTAAQFDLIHWLQGQEILFKKGTGTAIEPHTRLTSIKMALDIDYAGLWCRARHTTLLGQSLLTLAPEDEFITLAIHGGKEMWWNIKWVCDVATFLEAHPNLDWSSIGERARAQGCARMVLLASILAHRHFGATLPEAIMAAQRTDPRIEAMAARILARWQSEEPLGPPSNKTLSMDRMLLHDGLIQRMRYVLRTLFLPGPQHVALMALPSGFGFAYISIKIGHDAIALPLWRAYRQSMTLAQRLYHALEGSYLAHAMLPASAQTRQVTNRHRATTAKVSATIANNPNNAGDWQKLGHAFFGLKKYNDAIDAYDHALRIAPDSTGIWKDRGAATRAIGMKSENSDLEEDKNFDQQDADAWALRAGYYAATRRFGKASEASDRALAIDPMNLAAMRIDIRSRISACDWQKWDQDIQTVAENLKAGRAVITPFNHQAISNSEAENLVAAQLWAKRVVRPAEPLWKGELFDHDRIRIAYLSAEFQDHATATLIAGLFEHHDKSRFKIIAISLGSDDGSKMRQRIKAAFDEFIDAQGMSDAEISTMMRQKEIDIAIHLSGNRGASRTGILAHRPAPIQVSYLGFPGTTALPFMDYIIADSIVVPREYFQYYTEKIVHLPHSYQCNDSRRQIPHYGPSRADAGLPENGFVFCCFNNNYKITPDVFDVWMRLLAACPDSVLWLLGDLPNTALNLRREALTRGIAPGRLIFASRVSVDDHLARHGLADLFLDTLPVNAHTTASDALWVGLPVLTCMGNTFAGRVATSLLRAVGLPELITSSLDEYEQLALALACDPERLANLRRKLLHNRDCTPLFDTEGYTRNLEAAFLTMWQRQQQSLPPAHFEVRTGSVSDNSALYSADAETWASQARALSLSRRYADAAKASDRALALNPSLISATRTGIHCRLHACDWSRREADHEQIAQGLATGEFLIAPIDHRAICDFEQELRQTSQFVTKKFLAIESSIWRKATYGHDKIRVAYISADLRAHPTSFLMAGVFEHHQKSHFKTFAFSTCPDDGSKMRQRIKTAFDEFIDAQGMSDAEIAAMMRSNEIDIAVDLNGYAGHMRPGILARRPAPIQVNYLGCPGTMAAPFADYVIADHIVIPDENRAYYDEKIVYLPVTYQPTDSTRRNISGTQTRIAAGLPQTGFVFSCLNNSFKISPEIFDVWMRILRAVDDSVLWLLEDNNEASFNLKREADKRGVSAQRLIFAPRLPPSEHLDRQCLADLFLDTLPYNAHTTASDALWAGLPVLTCIGNAFAGRVAASVLYAIGLPELVTTSLAEYEELAVALARDPQRLADIKRKLLHNRDREPLFDTAGYTRELEASYLAMWKRQEQGLPPADIAVTRANTF